MDIDLPTKNTEHMRLLPNSKFFMVLKEESRIGGIPPIDQ
jgi:hypothetical protein